MPEGGTQMGIIRVIFHNAPMRKSPNAAPRGSLGLFVVWWLLGGPGI